MIEILERTILTLAKEKTLGEKVFCAFYFDNILSNKCYHIVFMNNI